MSGSRAKKTEVITSLLTGNTIAFTAKAVGCEERTIYRWLKDESFIRELHQAEKQVLEGVGWKLVSMSKKASDAIEDVIEHPSEPGANVKRLAGVAVLELLIKWRDTMDFEERLTKLERQVLK